MTKRDKQLFERVDRRAHELFEATPRGNTKRNLIYTAMVMIRAGVLLLDSEKLAELEANKAAEA